MAEWMEEVDAARGDFRILLRMDRMLCQSESEHQNLVIFENRTFGRVLALDGVVQTTERDEFFYHEMLVHVPVLAHGAVRRMLIIGGGDGGALEEALKHRSIERVTMVEIDASVVEVSKEYLRPICGDAFEDPRLDLVFADGLEFVTRSEELYDVILVDSADPVAAGEVLFSEGFYRNCKTCLAPGGLLVTQNALPFIERKWLSVPLRRLQKQFADASCYLAPVPSFYGGAMAFGWATDDKDLRRIPLEELQRRFLAAAIDTRYYTPATHQGAFALPPYMTAMLP